MSAVGVAMAQGKRCDLAVLATEMPLTEQVGGVRLADLEHETVHEHGVPRSEVEVAAAELLPVLEVEDRLELHGRRQLEHRVTVVVRLAGTEVVAIGAGHVDVPLRVDDRRAAAHPHRSPIRAAADLEIVQRSPRLRDRDDVAVSGTVGAGTVASVLAVGDDHATVVERQPWPLQLRELVLARAGHRRLAQLDLPREQVEPEQAVRRLHALRGRRAFYQGVRVDEDLVARQVDHRGAGNADHGRDVAARQVTGWHGARQVARPQDAPAAGGHHVDGVVLGRRDDPAVGDERLAEQLPVKDRRDPGLP